MTKFPVEQFRPPRWRHGQRSALMSDHALETKKGELAGLEPNTRRFAAKSFKPGHDAERDGRLYPGLRGPEYVLGTQDAFKSARRPAMFVFRDWEALDELCKHGPSLAGWHEIHMFVGESGRYEDEFERVGEPSWLQVLEGNGQSFYDWTEKINNGSNDPAKTLMIVPWPVAKLYFPPQWLSAKLKGKMDGTRRGEVNEDWEEEDWEY